MLAICWKHLIASHKAYSQNALVGRMLPISTVVLPLCVTFPPIDTIYDPLRKSEVNLTLTIIYNMRFSVEHSLLTFQTLKKLAGGKSNKERI